MLTAITPTGDRPEAFALAQEYMADQSYGGPVRWIVVDDGHEPLTPCFSRRGYELETHRLPPMAGNSQCRNLLHALDLVEGDGPVVCWEDDDIYLRPHLSAMAEALESVELAGERVSRYYNVHARRWRLMPGKFHASLATVGLKGPAIALLRKVCEAGSRRIDMDLWSQFTGPKRLLDTAHVIGVKGMPGRTGIGVGHRPTFGEPDTTGILHKWAGDEYAINYDRYRATR